MNKYRSLIALLISATLGLGVVGLLSSWMKRQQNADTLDVVVAAQDIAVGTRLQAGMLKSVRWPASVPMKDPVRSLDEGLDRVVNIALFQDEPLLKSKLAPAGEKGGLSAQLPDGKRAVTVKVNEIIGVAGFALPGNYVDVMVHATDGQNNPTSKIVLERIQVLAVAQDISTPEGKPKVVNAVTLEVTPGQAEAIDLARSVGTLSLVLRNQRDKEGVVTAGARKNDLLHTTAHTAGRYEAAKDQPPTSNRKAVAAPSSRAATPPTVAGTQPTAWVIRGLAVSAE